MTHLHCDVVDGAGSAKMIIVTRKCVIGLPLNDQELKLRKKGRSWERGAHNHCFDCTSRRMPLNAQLRKAEALWRMIADVPKRSLAPLNGLPLQTRSVFSFHHHQRHVPGQTSPRFDRSRVNSDLLVDSVTLDLPFCFHFCYPATGIFRRPF